MTSDARVTCREIAEGDLDAVATVLTEGFPERSRAYWDGAMRALATRDAPEGYPRFGLMLEAEGACVGVLLQIFSRVDGALRCNLSSWRVKPAYRGYATLLSSRAKARREATYLNVSPAGHTWDILTAQGFQRYSAGQIACLPALSPRGRRRRARPWRGGEAGQPDGVAALLDAHAAMGAIVLVSEGPDGAHPFVFLRRRAKRVGRRVAQLVWRPHDAEFADHAGPLGRALLRRHGLPIVLLDATGREPGLVGRYFPGRQPKYFRGPARPRLNDLAFTEAVVFGP